MCLPWRSATSAPGHSWPWWDCHFQHPLPCLYAFVSFHPCSILRFPTWHVARDPPARLPNYERPFEEGTEVRSSSTAWVVDSR